MLSRKMTLWLGALLMVILMGGCASESAEKAPATDTETETAAPSAAVLEVVDLNRFQELRKSANVQVLDVRTEGEVAAGIIAGATAISVHDPEFATKVQAQLDPNKPVAVYCQSGGRSSRAAREMSEMGFQTVYNFQGGIGEWRGNQLPLER